MKVAVAVAVLVVVGLVVPVLGATLDQPGRVSTGSRLRGTLPRPGSILVLGGLLIVPWFQDMSTYLE